jgi:rhamnosyl/mannosyltransferase
MAVLAHVVSRPQATVQVATWHHDLVRHQVFNTLMRPLLERFLTGMDAIFVTAPAMIEHSPMLRQFRDKCRVVPLGVDHEPFASVDADKVLDVRAKYPGPLILYVGRLVYYKGCEVLLEAMRHLEPATLVMVGAGPLEARLRAQIERHGLGNVHLLGRLAAHDLQTLFKACDVFVLPSTLPTECFGLVQVEAMLSGKPVVNTDLPTGVPWVSEHEKTGLTVPVNDARALAHALERLLNDQRARHTMGAAGRVRALELFTLDKHIGMTIKEYEQLLKSKVPVAVRDTLSGLYR